MQEDKCILLVEDEQALGYLLSEYLKMKAFAIYWAKDGKEALQLLKRRQFDLGILDVTMPEMDGFTLAKTIKKDYPELPFLFLTARSLKVDVLKGFALGAIDYLKKPIDEEELVARIHAILSRMDTKTQKELEQSFQLGQYAFDPLNQKLTYNQQETTLTSRESELLRLLAQHRNVLCSHREILTQLWGENDYFNRKSLNVFVTRLRSYLKDDQDVRIENVHGKGFILRVPED